MDLWGSGVNFGERYAITKGAGGAAMVLGVLGMAGDPEFGATLFAGGAILWGGSYVASIAEDLYALRRMREEELERTEEEKTYVTPRNDAQEATYEAD